MRRLSMVAVVGLLGLAVPALPVGAVADSPQYVFPTQTISFSAPQLGVVGGSYTPSATASSGLPVSFSVDVASTGCSLTGGVVYFDSVGICGIDANQAGDMLHAPAPQEQGVTTIDPPYGPRGDCQGPALTAPVNPSSAPGDASATVSWSPTQQAPPAGCVVCRDPIVERRRAITGSDSWSWIDDRDHGSHERRVVLLHDRIRERYGDRPRVDGHVADHRRRTLPSSSRQSGAGRERRTQGCVPPGAEERRAHHRLHRDLPCHEQPAEEIQDRQGGPDHDHGTRARQDVHMQGHGDKSARNRTARKHRDSEGVTLPTTDQGLLTQRRAAS